MLLVLSDENYSFVNFSRLRWASGGRIGSGGGRGPTESERRGQVAPISTERKLVL